MPLPAPHAPTASGWSNSYRVGYLPPTGSTCPFHGARFLRARRPDKRLGRSDSPRPQRFRVAMRAGLSSSKSSPYQPLPYPVAKYGKAKSLH